MKKKWDLTKLQPDLFPNRLRFVCPICEFPHFHVVRFGEGAWHREGKLENLTVSPSYRSLVRGCGFHFNITDGKVVES